MGSWRRGGGYRRLMGVGPLCLSDIYLMRGAAGGVEFGGSPTGGGAVFIPSNWE